MVWKVKDDEEFAFAFTGVGEGRGEDDGVFGCEDCG